MTERRSPAARRPRPVWVASVLLTAFGLIGVVFAWVSEASLGAHGEAVKPALRALLYIQLVLSAAQAGSGLFLWQGRNWARVLALLLCGINIAGGVITLLSGALGAIVGIAVNVVLIKMLRDGEVWDWCNPRA